MTVPLFELESVTVAFNGRPVLRGVSFAVPEGGKVLLRGPSGSGKSTVLRLLLGFVQPDAGVVRIRGEAMTPEVAWRLRREVAYVNQAPDFEPGPVAGALDELVGFKAGGERPDDGARADALDAFGLPRDILNQDLSELSGGERHRVALAAATLLDRPRFLLDEPSAALDGQLKRGVADRFLGRPHWTVVAAAHDDVWLDGRDVTVIDLEGRA